MKNLHGGPLLVAAILLAGCSSATDTEAENSTPTTETAPSGGNGDPVSPPLEPPATGELVTLSPVNIQATATLPNKLEVRLLSLTSGEVKASRPGEVSGPSVTVEMEATNQGAEETDLAPLSVTAYAGSKRIPLAPFTDAGTPFAAVLASGDTATGTYSFALPQGSNPVRVEVIYGGETRVLAFKGRV
jgi:hypothetical protein